MRSALATGGLLILILGLVFVLGFFFDWIEITLIVLPVFAPIITAMDFGDHVARMDIAYWLAILIAMNLQTSFLTPALRFRAVLFSRRRPRRASRCNKSTAGSCLSCCCSSWR